MGVNIEIIMFLHDAELFFSYVDSKEFPKELNRAEQAERWQVSFRVNVSKEINLGKNSLPMPTWCEAWKRQLQLKKEILESSLTALGNFWLSVQEQTKRKHQCVLGIMRKGNENKTEKNTATT